MSSVPDVVGPGQPVAPDEPLARYIIEKRRIDYNLAPPQVREKNFHPQNGETSTFRILGLSPEQSQELGRTEFADKQTPPKQLLGWAQLAARSVGEASPRLHLDITPDPANPAHPRHAGIKGWPDVGTEQGKSQMKSLAQLLASKSRFVPVPIESQTV